MSRRLVRIEPIKESKYKCSYSYCFTPIENRIEVEDIDRNLSAMGPDNNV